MEITCPPSGPRRCQDSAGSRAAKQVPVSRKVSTVKRLLTDFDCRLMPGFRSQSEPRAFIRFLKSPRQFTVVAPYCSAARPQGTRPLVSRSFGDNDEVNPTILFFLSLLGGGFTYPGRDARFIDAFLHDVLFR